MKSTKVCPVCRIEKNAGYFYPKRLKNGTLGIRSYCKECGTKERNAWRASSPADNERNKAYNKAHAEEIRGKKLVKNYWPHLTWQQAVEAWDDLYAYQKGSCALCPNRSRLHVDHCHATGKVRGLLCYNCNNGIGRLKDSVTILRNAINYLVRAKESA